MEQRQNNADVELNTLDTSTAIPIKEGHAGLPSGVASLKSATRIHYAPRTEVEQMLDKSINLKYDLCAIYVLAMDLFLQQLSSASVEYAVTGSDFLRETHLQADDIVDSQQLFLAAYITLAPFLAILGRVCGLRNFVVGLAACSGALTMSHAAIHNLESLFLLRILLGVVQSGFLPTAWTYIAGVYPKEYLGFRMALFTGLYSVLSSFKGLTAYAVFKTNKNTMLRWQALFVIDGFITIIFAFISLAMLPKTVAEAWFLSPLEKRHAKKRMNLDLGYALESLGSTAVAITDIVEVVKDWRKLSVVAFNCLAAVPDAAFETFMPMVLQAMGYTGTEERLLSIVPFVTGFIALVIISKLSDRWRERSLWVACGGCITTIGLVAFLASGNAIIRYVFIHVCIGGSLLVEPLVAAWLAGNTPKAAQKSIVMGLNGWSEVSIVIAGQLFKGRHAPSYRNPLGICLLFLGISLGGFVMVRWSYSRLNATRIKDTKNWTRDRLNRDMANGVIRGDHVKTYLYGY